MAGDSQNMERSTLERKDRAELAAVAEALGLKVPSRAKKSDIITLILDVVSPGAGESEPDAADSGGGADDAPAPAADSGTPSSGGDATAADATAADAPVNDAAPASGDATAKKAATAKGAAADGDSSGDDDAGNESAGSENAEADGADGDGNQEGSGRRRRRRRGRGDRPDGDGSPGEGEGEPVEVAGLLDLRDDGYGFLRVAGFLPSRDDVYVSVKQCRQLGLRKGDHIGGLARPAGHKEKNPALMRVETVNGLDPEQARTRVRFDDLTAIAPDAAETVAEVSDDALGPVGGAVEVGGRLGLGQRALLEAPRRADRTSVIKAVAAAVEERQPDAHLIVLLVDERPEDVTDVGRSLERGDVVASTFDRPSEEHAAVAELTIEHAKRLVEYGNDVVILFDGLTRLARAYNLVATGGRPLAGGLDTTAVHPVKRFFGAARNLEEGGSLTILATVAVDTPSALDAEIRDELDGTANLEVRLAPSAPR